jgi:hypothetical protein
VEVEQLHDTWHLVSIYKVTYHVDVARLPAYVGNNLVRYFTLGDGILSITTPSYTIEGEG